MSFQVNLKPTFLTELTSIPSDRVPNLMSKVNILAADPFPDGKMRKKLTGMDGLYRLRVGDLRVFYRIGDGYVSLLGVRWRREDTYRGLGSDSDPLLDNEDFGEDDLDNALAAGRPKKFQFQAVQEEELLPVELSRDWLLAHNVPEMHFKALERCRTEDDLLEAPVPADLKARILDMIFPPSIDTVDKEPDLVVQKTEDLIRYREGDLVGFLLRLDEEQMRLTKWALKGPTMVRGGAGTGKSTVALYRVKEILERGDGTERVLFTTYTNALLRVSEELLRELLTPEQLGRVEISTCDSIVHKIVSSKRKIRGFLQTYEARRILQEVLDTIALSGKNKLEAQVKRHLLLKLGVDYLMEEIDWIIEGRGLKTLEEYLSAARPGRSIGLNQRAREAVWEANLVYQERIKAKERFETLRKEALELVQAGEFTKRWDHVFVDEAQDLSPVSLSLLAELSRSAEGLFFAADSKQSLYSRNYTWSSAHPRLQFQGRSAILKRNYRSTGEIDRAAFSVLEAEEGEEVVASTSMHQGPLPVLLKGTNEETEARWIAQFIRQMTRHLHLKSSAAAVLVPTGKVGEALAKRLNYEDLAARYFKGTELNLSTNEVKVLTLHSAKGLEFPVVVVAGWRPGTYPDPNDFENPELFAERLRNDRRRIYVGLTRAMRGLMLVVPDDCSHQALVEIDTANWHLEVAK